MPYVLDTNVFIEAKDTYYMFDVCPGFWDWLIIQNKEGNLYSTLAVNDELQKGDDDLSGWAKDRGYDFFLPPNSDTEDALLKIDAKVLTLDYADSAIDEFRRSADYYIVAEAYAREYAVITRETLSDGKNRIKIPNICDNLKIKCMNTFEMLHAERARFMLSNESALGK